MRLVLFEGPGAGRGIRPGVLTEAGVVDVSSATAALVAHSPQHLMEQVIDNFDKDRNHKLGLVFEAKVGKGKLVVCSIGLRKDREQNPVARQMLHDIAQARVVDRGEQGAMGYGLVPQGDVVTQRAVEEADVLIDR